MNEELLQALYETYGAQTDVKDFDEFKSGMDDPTARQAFYNHFSDTFEGLESYEEFDTLLGYREEPRTEKIGSAAVEALKNVGNPMAAAADFITTYAGNVATRSARGEKAREENYEENVEVFEQTAPMVSGTDDRLEARDKFRKAYRAGADAVKALDTRLAKKYGPDWREVGDPQEIMKDSDYMQLQQTIEGLNDIEKRRKDLFPNEERMKEKAEFLRNNSQMINDAINLTPMGSVFGKDRVAGLSSWIVNSSIDVASLASGAADKVGLDRLAMRIRSGEGPGTIASMEGYRDVLEAAQTSKFEGEPLEIQYDDEETGEKAVFNEDGELTTIRNKDGYTRQPNKKDREKYEDKFDEAELDFSLGRTLSSAENSIYDLVSSVGFAYGVTKGLTGKAAKLAGMSAIGGSTSVQMLGDEYTQLLNEGRDPSQAINTATTKAVATGIMESLIGPLEINLARMGKTVPKSFRRTPEVSKLINDFVTNKITRRKYTRGMVKAVETFAKENFGEVGEELAQETVGNYIDAVTYDDPMEAMSMLEASNIALTTIATTMLPSFLSSGASYKKANADVFTKAVYESSQNLDYFQERLEASEDIGPADKAQIMSAVKLVKEEIDAYNISEEKGEQATALILNKARLKLRLNQTTESEAARKIYEKQLEQVEKEFENFINQKPQTDAQEEEELQEEDQIQERETEEKVEETPAEPLPSVTEEQYNAFVDTGEVSDDVVTLVADKMQSNEELTPEELAIYSGQSDRIETELRSRATETTESIASGPIIETRKSKAFRELEQEWQKAQNARPSVRVRNGTLTASKNLDPDFSLEENIIYDLLAGVRFTPSSSELTSRLKVGLNESNTFRFTDKKGHIFEDYVSELADKWSRDYDEVADMIAGYIQNDNVSLRESAADIIAAREEIENPILASDPGAIMEARRDQIHQDIDNVQPQEAEAIAQIIEPYYDEQGNFDYERFENDYQEGQLQEHPLLDEIFYRETQDYITYPETEAIFESENGRQRIVENDQGEQVVEFKRGDAWIPYKNQNSPVVRSVFNEYITPLPEASIPAPQEPATTDEPTVSTTEQEDIQVFESLFGSPKAKVTNTIFQRGLRNIAKRMGMSYDELRQRLSLAKVSREIPSSVSMLTSTLDNYFVDNYKDVDVYLQTDSQQGISSVPVEFINSKGEVLPENRQRMFLAAINRFPELLEKLRSIVSDKTRLNTGLRETINKKQQEIAELFKNNKREQAQIMIGEIQELKQMLNESENNQTVQIEYSSLRDMIMGEIKKKYDNLDQYLMEDFSDKFIEETIVRFQRAGDARNVQLWESIRDNESSRQEAIKEARKNQRDAFMQGFGYLYGNEDYNPEFQVLMLDEVLKRNYVDQFITDEQGERVATGNKIIVSRNKNTVGTPTILSAAALPLVQENMLEGDQRNPLILHSNALSEVGQVDKSEIAEIKQRYVYKKRPGGVWVKIPRDSDGVDLQKLAVQSHELGGNWCTGTALSTAKNHSSGGDFYLFVTNNNEVQLAARYKNNTLDEPIRGNKDSSQKIAEEYIDEAEWFMQNEPGARKYLGYAATYKLVQRIESRQKPTLQPEDAELFFSAQEVEFDDGSYDFNQSKRSSLIIINTFRNSPEFQQSLKQSYAEKYNVKPSEVFFNGRGDLDRIGLPEGIKVLIDMAHAFNPDDYFMSSLKLEDTFKAENLEHIMSDRGLTIGEGSKIYPNLKTIQCRSLSLHVGRNNQTPSLQKINISSGVTLYYYNSFPGDKPVDFSDRFNNTELNVSDIGKVFITSINTTDDIIDVRFKKINAYGIDILSKMNVNIPNVTRLEELGLDDSVGEISLPDLTRLSFLDVTNGGGVNADPVRVNAPNLESISYLDLTDSSKPAPHIISNKEVRVRHMDFSNKSYTKQLFIPSNVTVEIVKYDKGYSFVPIRNFERQPTRIRIEGSIPLSSFEFDFIEDSPTDVSNFISNIEELVEKSKNMNVDPSSKIVNIKVYRDYVSPEVARQFEQALIDSDKLFMELDRAGKHDHYLVTYPENAENPKALYQEGKAFFASAYNGQMVIGLGKNSDVTSPMHELAHAFEKVITDEERQAVLDWTGHDTWTRETSEAFAKGFERYLYEGRYPDEKSRNLFEKFAIWVRSAIDNALAYFGDINELNDEVAAIYDAIVEQDTTSELTTQQEIVQDTNMSPEAKVQALVDNFGVDPVEADRMVVDYLKSLVKENEIDHDNEFTNRIRRRTGQEKGTRIKSKKTIKSMLNDVDPNDFPIRYNLYRSIQMILPILKKSGFEIVVHEGLESYANSRDQFNLDPYEATTTNGFISGNEIHINAVKGFINDTTAMHEFLHPIMEAVMRRNMDLYRSLLDYVQLAFKDERKGKQLRERYEEKFGKNYENPSDQELETMIQYLAEEHLYYRNAEGGVNPAYKTSYVNQFFENIRRWFMDLFGIQDDLEIFDAKDASTFLVRLKESIRTGRPIRFDAMGTTQHSIIGEQGANRMDLFLSSKLKDAKKLEEQLNLGSWAWWKDVNFDITNNPANAIISTIWGATGWERAPDGRWVTWIGNSPLAERTRGLELENSFLEKYIKVSTEQKPQVTTLGNIITEDSAILKAYPILTNFIVVSEKIPDSFDEYRSGKYNPNTKTISVKFKKEEDYQHVLLHEIQHAIQEFEKFPSFGSNKSIAISYLVALYAPKQFRLFANVYEQRGDYETRDGLKKIGIPETAIDQIFRHINTVYKASSGETQARTASIMTPFSSIARQSDIFQPSEQLVDSDVFDFIDHIYSTRESRKSPYTSDALQRLFEKFSNNNMLTSEDGTLSTVFMRAMREMGLTERQIEDEYQKYLRGSDKLGSTEASTRFLNKLLNSPSTNWNPGLVVRLKNLWSGRVMEVLSDQELEFTYRQMLRQFNGDIDALVKTIAPETFTIPPELKHAVLTQAMAHSISSVTYGGITPETVMIGTEAIKRLEQASGRILRFSQGRFNRFYGPFQAIVENRANFYSSMDESVRVEVQELVSDLQLTEDEIEEVVGKMMKNKEALKAVLASPKVNREELLQRANEIWKSIGYDNPYVKQSKKRKTPKLIKEFDKLISILEGYIFASNGDIHFALIEMQRNDKEAYDALSKKPRDFERVKANMSVRADEIRADLARFEIRESLERMAKGEPIRPRVRQSTTHYTDRFVIHMMRTMFPDMKESDRKVRAKDLLKTLVKDEDYVNQIETTLKDFSEVIDTPDGLAIRGGRDRLIAEHGNYLLKRIQSKTRTTPPIKGAIEKTIEEMENDILDFLKQYYNKSSERIVDNFEEEVMKKLGYLNVSQAQALKNYIRPFFKEYIERERSDRIRQYLKENPQQDNAESMIYAILAGALDYGNTISMFQKTFGDKVTRKQLLSFEYAKKLQDLAMRYAYLQDAGFEKERQKTVQEIGTVIYDMKRENNTWWSNMISLLEEWWYMSVLSSAGTAIKALFGAASEATITNMINVGSNVVKGLYMAAGGNVKGGWNRMVMSFYIPFTYALMGDGFTPGRDITSHVMNIADIIANDMNSLSLLDQRGKLPSEGILTRKANAVLGNLAVEKIVRGDFKGLIADMKGRNVDLGNGVFINALTYLTAPVFLLPTAFLSRGLKVADYVVSSYSKRANLGFVVLDKIFEGTEVEDQSFKGLKESFLDNVGMSPAQIEYIETVIDGRVEERNAERKAEGKGPMSKANEYIFRAKLRRDAEFNNVDRDVMNVVTRMTQYDMLMGTPHGRVGMAVDMFNRLAYQKADKEYDPRETLGGKIKDGFIDFITRGLKLTTLPFASVAGNFVNKAIDYTPAGIIMTTAIQDGKVRIKNPVTGKWEKRKLTPTELSRKAGSALIGSTIFFMFIASLTGEEEDETGFTMRVPLLDLGIRITGPGTGNYVEDQTIADDGYEPYAFQYYNKENDRWVTAQTWSNHPVGISFMPTAVVTDRYLLSKQKSELMSAGGGWLEAMFNPSVIARNLSFFSAQTFNQTLEDVFKILGVVTAQGQQSQGISEAERSIQQGQATFLGMFSRTTRGLVTPNWIRLTERIRKDVEEDPLRYSRNPLNRIFMDNPVFQNYFLEKSLTDGMGNKVVPDANTQVELDWLLLELLNVDYASDELKKNSPLYKFAYESPGVAVPKAYIVRDNNTGLSSKIPEEMRTWIRDESARLIDKNMDTERFVASIKRQQERSNDVRHKANVKIEAERNKLASEAKVKGFNRLLEGVTGTTLSSDNTSWERFKERAKRENIFIRSAPVFSPHVIEISRDGKIYRVTRDELKEIFPDSD